VYVVVNIAIVLGFVSMVARTVDFDVIFFWAWDTYHCVRFVWIAHTGPLRYYNVPLERLVCVFRMLEFAFFTITTVIIQHLAFGVHLYVFNWPCVRW
jgi:hypothetical protein